MNFWPLLAVRYVQQCQRKFAKLHKPSRTLALLKYSPRYGIGIILYSVYSNLRGHRSHIYNIAHIQKYTNCTFKVATRSYTYRYTRAKMLAQQYNIQEVWRRAKRKRERMRPRSRAYQSQVRRASIVVGAQVG